MKCKYCGKEFIQKTSSVQYCSSKCKNDDRLQDFEDVESGEKFKAWKSNAEKYPDFYSYTRIKRVEKFGGYEKCYICGSIFSKNSMTCSTECAKRMKENTWKRTQGASHNLSRNSKSRKEWESKLLENEGIVNVFQRELVKEKSRAAWKTYNPSQLEYVKILKRKTFEDNRMWIPFEKYSEYRMYVYHVGIFTGISLKKYAEKTFGVNWQEKVGFFEHHVDHIFSKNRGFWEKIPAHVIGSIVNLRLLDWKENISKGTKCDISKEDLLYLYENFNNEEYENFVIEHYEYVEKCKNKENNENCT